MCLYQTLGLVNHHWVEFPRIDIPEAEFPRRTLIGSSVSKGNSAPRHWLSLICWREIREKRIIKLVGASSLEALREGQTRRKAGAQSHGPLKKEAAGLPNRASQGFD
jgi:hypothetical protein